MARKVDPSKGAGQDPLRSGVEANRTDDAIRAVVELHLRIDIDGQHAVDHLAAKAMMLRRCDRGPVPFLPDKPNATLDPFPKFCILTKTRL